jgi:hypothetical protein
MALKLTEPQVNILEDLIANKSPVEPHNILGCISFGDIANGMKSYLYLKNEEEPETEREPETEPETEREREDKPNYIRFGESAMGYNVYSLYKSENKNIYLIYVSIQTPINYAIIENESIFMNYLPNYIVM